MNILIALGFDLMKNTSSEMLQQIYLTTVHVVAEERRKIAKFRDRIFSTVEGDGEPIYSVGQYGIGLMGEEFITNCVILRLLEETDWKMVSEPRPIGGSKYADLRAYISSSQYLDIEFKRVLNGGWWMVRKEISNPELAGILTVWETNNFESEVPNDFNIIPGCFTNLEAIEGLPFCRVVFLKTSI